MDAEDDWNFDMASAPSDGEPLLLFARARGATTPVVFIGWNTPDGWIETCIGGNQPHGIEPIAWKYRPKAPSGWLEKFGAA